jgi:hypothetical protein
MTIEYRKEWRRVKAGEGERCEPHVVVKIWKVGLETSGCEYLARLNDKMSGVLD